MLDIVSLDWVILAFLCCATAFIAVHWMTPRHNQPDNHVPVQVEERDQVLLFDGNDLIEASTGASVTFKTDEAGFNWTSLYDALVRKYPKFPENPQEIQNKKVLTVHAGRKGKGGRITCEWIDGITRVSLQGQDSPERCPLETTKELDMLRQAAENAPNPSWHVDPDGKISWSNDAYTRLCKKVTGDKKNAPPVMFPSVSGKGQAGKKTRTSVAVPGSDQKLWFDVAVVRQDSGLLCYAVDINAVVDAEHAQRNFVQTLAKTFAHLSIGLAIFDRNRQLALFNPALIDLTTLPAEFLSARPNLLSFFDRLRDQRMMPEPKNYSSWRLQMADLVAAAADGRYQETWTLPSGAVYSVSGRPHPDGAVAFLIEDITAEITLTRRFRTDLEINQSMIDQMEDAIAVFSDNGALCFSNKAYRAMWNVDPEGSFVQMTVLDATRTWQGMCHPTPVLGEVRNFVGVRENRSEWWDRIQLLTGQIMTFGVFPVSHGATMIIFSRQHPENVPPDTKIPARRAEQNTNT